MFNKISPEKAGISSEKIQHFVETLNSYKINTHSLIMARGNDIFAESYYKPYNQNTLHRMYSISKSFVAIAVGLAEQEGLLSLDDNFLDYFPEYVNENIDDKYRKTTIRDMLSMRSCMADYAVWWGGDDRAKAYFTKTSNQVPGTNFHYDSSGSFLLGCIVEKVTGKLFLEYLKEKVLLKIGFSKESYCLLAPGGHSHGDSGVMCTPRDLLIFARFIMNGGVWNGKRYINEEFMCAAVSKQTDNNLSGLATPLCDHNGYGYLIWKMPRDGFALIGMADQIAVCDPKTDFIFVMTAENMNLGDITRTVIMHELYNDIIPNLDKPLEENVKAYDALETFLAGQKLLTLTGSVSKNIAQEISGNKYVLEENVMGIKTVSVTLDGDKGIFKYENSQGENCIEFGIGYNKFGKFPGNKRMGLTASVYEEGTYDCCASAVWCEEAKLHILVRVIDTYLGTWSIVLGFKGDEITVTMNKYAQRILDDLEGTTAGKLI
ncbi:MAG: serine hydrolase [Ruminococcaceae bacterium]|nr:serine hydrolase [Oscillospiraceae bacterium]